MNLMKATYFESGNVPQVCILSMNLMKATYFESGNVPRVGILSTMNHMKLTYLQSGNVPQVCNYRGQNRRALLTSFWPSGGERVVCVKINLLLKNYWQINCRCYLAGKCLLCLIYLAMISKCHLKRFLASINFCSYFLFPVQEQADEILLIYDWGEVTMLGVLPAAAAGFVVLAILFRAISLPFERAGCCGKRRTESGAVQGGETAPHRPLPQVPPHTQGTCKNKKQIITSNKLKKGSDL